MANWVMGPNFIGFYRRGVVGVQLRRFWERTGRGVSPRNR